MLDPLDGTKGFLRGGQYAVALALLEQGEVQLGVLGCPNLINARIMPQNAAGWLVFARRGCGSWATSLAGDTPFTRIRVSDRETPEVARILRSLEDSHTNAGQIDRLASILGTHSLPIRLDSQVKYALLACGEGDILIRMLSPNRMDYREKIWDQAVGSLIIEEAGGRTTDLDGQPLDFKQGRSLARNRGILATNGHLHDFVLQALKAVEVR